MGDPWTPHRRATGSTARVWGTGLGRFRDGAGAREPDAAAMARILAFSSPAPGHLLPLAPGLKALAERGHEVHLVADPHGLGLVADLGLATTELDPRIAAIRVDDHLAKPGLDRVSRGIQRLMERGPYEREQIAQLVEAWEPDALVVDFNANGASTYAAASGLPWAFSFPTLIPIPEPGIPPFGLGLRRMGGPLGRLRDAVLTRIVMGSYNKAILPGLNGLRADVGLAPVGDVVEHMLSADLFLALTGEPLEYPRPKSPAHVRMVGTSAYDPPAATPAWMLEAGDPWVLVTCSTEYQGDERLASTAIEALRDEPVRVLVTVGDADPAALPTADNVRIEPFVPHGAVLPHTSVVVTHGGMGITQKAMLSATPLVVVPFGRDQPEVARRVADCGAGVQLPLKRLTADRLRGAVREAMAMQERAAAAGRRLAAAGGAVAFADAVEELVPAAAARVAAPALHALAR